MTNKTKILLITTTSDSIISFRMPLIKALESKGYDVYLITGDKKREEDLKQLGLKVFYALCSNKSINLFSTLKYKKNLVKIIKSINPDIVFTFMAKPNIYGVTASKKCGVKYIFSMVEGLGEPFSKNSVFWSIVRRVELFLFKKSFSFAKKVFLLNNDDKLELVSKKIVSKEKAIVIHGIGVDLDHFVFNEMKGNGHFLMVARMNKSKGVLDYCECARFVKNKYPNTKFTFVGPKGSLKEKYISFYKENNIVDFIGFSKDVRKMLSDCFLFILPSVYREGLPMSLMEAEASGRPVLVYDNVGCKDTVVDGYNGFIVKKGSVEELASKCCYAINNYDNIVQMGRNARKFAEENFDSNITNKKIINIIEESFI